MIRFTGFLTLTIACLTLAGCRSGIPMNDPSIKPGNYHVAAIEVVGSPALRADMQAGVPVFAPLLHNKLSNYAMRFNRPGRDVIVYVQISSLDIAVNSGQSLLIGDHRSVRSDVMILDAQTRTLLGTKMIENQGPARDGILGALTNNILSDDLENSNLANKHAASIIDQVYP